MHKQLDENSPTSGMLLFAAIWGALLIHAALFSLRLPG
jgi:hypothetical protein